MRLRSSVTIVMCGLLGLLGLVVAAPSQSAWAQRPPKAQLSDVPRLKKKLQHADPRVRRKTLSNLSSSFGATDQVARALAPRVRRMAAGDPDCKARVQAVRMLMWRRRALGRSPEKAIRKALFDACPLAQARGADWMKGVPAGQRRRVVRRLMRLAQKSRFYHVQCSALIALGKLRVKKAVKLMARALAVGTKTGLSGGRTHYVGVGSMPQCAVQALEHLTSPAHKAKSALVKRRDAILKKLKGKHSKARRKQLYKEYFRIHLKVIRASIRRPPATTVDQVRRWRKRLAKRGLVTPCPTPLCLSAKTCPLGQACLHMTCVPIARAMKAYRTYRQQRPIRRRRKRLRRLGWRNDEDPLAIRLGLGMGGARWVANLTRHRTRARLSARQMSHLELRQRARQSWLAGQCGRAIRLGRRAYKLKASAHVASIIGACACSRRNHSLARWAYRRVGSGTKNMLVQICRQKGIQLP